MMLYIASGRPPETSSVAEHLSGEMADMLDNQNFIYTRIRCGADSVRHDALSGKYDSGHIHQDGFPFRSGPHPCQPYPSGVPCHQPCRQCAPAQPSRRRYDNSRHPGQPCRIKHLRRSSSGQYAHLQPFLEAF